jgi:hypothetical protein
MKVHHVDRASAERAARAAADRNSGRVGVADREERGRQGRVCATQGRDAWVAAARQSLAQG